MMYVCGPMTGIAEYNIPAFKAACIDLRARGREVTSPHEITPYTEGKQWSEYLREDVAALTHCTGIILLPEWRRSRGASAELLIAKILGLMVYDYDPGFDENGPLYARHITMLECLTSFMHAWLSS